MSVEDGGEPEAATPKKKRAEKKKPKKAKRSEGQDAIC
jgi:hypothetical protein